MSNSRYNILKWITFLALYAGYSHVIFCRKSITFVASALITEEGFRNEDLGLILSSFNVAYCISKFFCGILSDHANSKILFGIGLLLSGLLMFVISALKSVSFMVIAWFLMGIVQGGSWPACAQILRMWCLPTEFGFLWSVLSTSMNVAVMLCAIIVPQLLLVSSWQSTLQLMGTATVLTTPVIIFMVYSSPKEAGCDTNFPMNESSKSGGVGRGSFNDLIRSHLLWLLSIGYLVTSLIRTAMLDWSQLFLIQECNQSKIIAGAFISSMEAGGLLGQITAGFMADKLVAMSQKEDTSGSPRIIVLIAFTGLYLFGLTIFTSWIHEGSSKISIMMVGFILGGGLYGPTALYGIMAVEAAPAHLSGTSHAIVSMASSVGAVLSGLPMSVIASILNWKGAFRSLQLIGVGMLTLHIITRNWPYKLIPTIKKLR